MHKQVKLADGVYVTDFRPNCELKGIDTSASKAPITDVSLLLQTINCNESKVKHLIFSIETMQEEEGWETDNEFVEAVNEDYERIIQFSAQMKESVLQLASLKYKPQNDQIEELIDANRIIEREKCIQEKFAKFLEEHGRCIVENTQNTQKQCKNNKVVEVSNENEENENEQQKTKNEKKQPKNEQSMADGDEGIYL